MSEEVEIIPYAPQQHTELVARIRAIEELRSSDTFRKGVHYGEPYKDAGKEVLLKPGAEMIMSRFHLWPDFIERSVIERWDGGSPLFHYRYDCRLIHRETGEVWGSGIGSCNSMEDKYGWRWVREHEIPHGVDKCLLESRGGTITEFDFAVDKAETSGKYGKPESYWQQFKSAIESGEAREIQKETKNGKSYKAWEIDATEYRIPNTNVFTLVNTIDKMAQKRALVAAVLIATGASAYFTQDVEDFPEYAGVIYDGEYEVIEPDAKPKGKAQPSTLETKPSWQGKTAKLVGGKLAGTLVKISQVLSQTELEITMPDGKTYKTDPSRIELVEEAPESPDPLPEEPVEDLPDADDIDAWFPPSSESSEDDGTSDPLNTEEIKRLLDFYDKQRPDLEGNRHALGASALKCFGIKNWMERLPFKGGYKVAEARLMARAADKKRELAQKPKNGAKVPETTESGESDLPNWTTGAGATKVSRLKKLTGMGPAEIIKALQELGAAVNTSMKPEDLAALIVTPESDEVPY